MRIAPLLCVLTGILTAGCGPKARISPPVLDLSPRLAEADALVNAGCFDCLQDALQKYQMLRTVSSAPAVAVDRATFGAFRAATLLALRQRELGMVDAGYWKTAKELRASWSCNGAFLSCEALDRLMEIIDGVPTASVGQAVGPPASDAQLAERQRFFRNRQEWSLLLREAAAQDALTAYVWLSFACGPAGNTTREESLAAVGVLRDLPLLRFKEVACYPQPERLQRILTDDPRFVEVTYLLGLAAIGQLKLDAAERAFETAYAWHPQWPALTLTLAGVAMTAEDFERSLGLYEKTLELAPRAMDGLLGKVRALSYLARHEPAIAAVDELLREQWYPGDARYWRAWNELQLGRLDQAWNDIEESARLLVNALVPKLAGLIAYRQYQLATVDNDQRRDRGDRRESSVQDSANVAASKLTVAGAKFEESLQREPRDCETGFYLGVVLADQRVWGRSADTFIAAAGCLEAAERALKFEIERIRASDDSPARQTRQIASREQRIASGRRMIAQSSFNTAVAYFNLQRGGEARPFAQRVADDEQFGERARDLLSRLK